MGGRLITDRKFFAGSGSPQFPKGVHVKTYSSSEGAGDVSLYEDTTEAVKAEQEIAKKKIHAYPMKPYYRQ